MCDVGSLAFDLCRALIHCAGQRGPARAAVWRRGLPLHRLRFAAGGVESLDRQRLLAGDRSGYELRDPVRRHRSVRRLGSGAQYHGSGLAAAGGAVAAAGGHCPGAAGRRAVRRSPGGIDPPVQVAALYRHPEEIVRGIEILNRYGNIDIIIVGRGGGSLEDLMAFNNEKVLRAVFSSKIPIISAVGHETDTTLCDYVADIRGATPSHAAEIATISLADNFIWLKNRLKVDYKRINRLINENYLNLDLKMEKFKVFSGKKDILKNKLVINLINMEKNFINLIELNKKNLMHRAEKLNLLSPLAILTKGYSIVYDKNQNIIKDENKVNIGDNVDIIMIKGKLKCKVEGKEFIHGK